jgi:tetratricopeptide (TPR) repeat protein
MKVSALQAWFGQDAEYRATCKRMIDAAEQTSKTEDVRERAARNWCLQPTNDPAMLQRVLALAREAAKAELNVGQRPWYQQALGMAEFRAGNDAAAEEAFLRAEQASKTGNWQPNLRSFVQVPCRFYRAMILFRQGKTAAAKTLFEEALAEMPPIPENAHRALPIQVNQDHLLCWLSHREASALLEINTSTKR